MFRRIGTLAVTFPKTVIVIWIAITIVVLITTPRLSSVVSSSQASYLPSSANSQRAQTILQHAFPRTYTRSTALIVLTGPKATRSRAITAYSDYAAHQLTPKPVVIASDTLTPQQRSLLDSRDGIASLISLGWTQPDSSPTLADAVKHLRSFIASHPYPGVTTRLTGDVPINVDYQAQIDKSTTISTIVTVVLVLVILLLLFRSVVLPLIPLFSIGLSLLISMGIVALLGQYIMTISSNTPIFMIVLLAGAGTDYCLFLANRFREELQKGEEPRAAVITTVTRVGAAIASSGIAVIVGMATMAFAQFGLFNTTGPAVAIGVAVMLVASLTLTPALMTLLGHHTFWPAATVTRPPSRFWAPLAKWVITYPAIVVVALLILLLPLNSAVFKTSQNYNFLNDLGKTVEARAGFVTVEQHFGAGDIQPMTLVIKAPHSLRNPQDLARLDRLDVTVAQLPDAASVQGPTRPNGQPIPYSVYATNRAVAATLAQNLSADGRVAQFTIVSTKDVYSGAANRLLHEAQAKALAAFPGAEVHMDGTTAVIADIKSVTHSDLLRILLFVLSGIFIVLMLLLRSIVAPLYLLVTVLLSLGATVGLTTVVFQGLDGQDGIVFWVPLLILTLLISLGTDYNILLMSRVREEAEKENDYHVAIARAVEHTGGIITSAGLILAGTFGTLMLASVTGLRELGFAVAVGVVFDTILVRAMLVPAVTVLLGRFAWLPGNLTMAERDRDDLQAA
jgi:RND superfamily putative drug exporter